MRKNYCDTSGLMSECKCSLANQCLCVHFQKSCIDSDRCAHYHDDMLNHCDNSAAQMDDRDN